MSHGDQREDQQGDGAADRGDRVELEHEGHDEAGYRLDQQPG
jgi:hypothetical protein